MNNIELVQRINTQNNIKIQLKNGILYIYLHTLTNRRRSEFRGLFEQEVDNSNFFTGCEIGHLMNIIGSAEKKYGGIKFTIMFIMNNVEFIDKLTYVLLECICYYLIKVKHHPVFIGMSCVDRIQTCGINSSPLLLLQTGKKVDNYRYIDKFDFDIYGYHYRRIIDGKEKQNTNFLGKYSQEIDSFLKPFGINEECRDMIALVCTELAGNAVEHGMAECLVDIDVAPDYKKVLEDGSFDANYYYGINIAIIDFSEVLLGDGIERNLLNCNKEIPIERYQKVLEAYKNHEALFDNYYDRVDFCNITAFQNKISGREEIEQTGGTGLPHLIKSLQEMSDTYRCYVVSGDRCVNFFKETICYSNDGWIGFNDKNDYFSDKPNESVCADCLIYMPGTAYNLNFIMQGVKIENDKN